MGSFFLIVSIIVFSPWMVRNTLWTNNPVYPLFNTIFNPPEEKSYSEIVKERMFDSSPSKKKLTHFSFRTLMYNEPWWRIALIPVRIFFEGQDGTPKYFDGRLNPLLFFLPLLAVVGLKKNTDIIRFEKAILLFYAILFILLVFFFIDMRIRWIAPAIPPLVILSMFGLHEVYALIAERFSEKGSKVFTGLVSVIIVLLVSSNMNYLLNQFRDVDPLSYILGRVGRDDYIERFRREHPTIQFANQNLAENAEILCLFLGKRRYYSDREMIFDEGFLLDTLKRAKSSTDVLMRLQKRGITHLLIRYDLFNQWQIDNFGKGEKAIFTKFFEVHLKPLFSRNNYGLFELKGP